MSVMHNIHKKHNIKRCTNLDVTYCAYNQMHIMSGIEQMPGSNAYNALNIFIIMHNRKSTDSILIIE